MAATKIQDHELIQERQDNDLMCYKAFKKYISEKYNLTPNSVYKRYKALHDMGGDLSELFSFEVYSKAQMLKDERTEKKTDRERNKKIAHAMLKSGDSVATIAQYIHVSTASVYRMLGELGVHAKQYQEVVDLSDTRLFPTGATRKDRHGNIQIHCMCLCKEQTWVRKSEYKRRRVRSCGCIKRELSKLMYVKDYKQSGGVV